MIGYQEPVFIATGMSRFLEHRPKNPRAATSYISNNPESDLIASHHLHSIPTSLPLPHDEPADHSCIHDVMPRCSVLSPSPYCMTAKTNRLLPHILMAFQAFLCCPPREK